MLSRRPRVGQPSYAPLATDAQMLDALAGLACRTDAAEAAEPCSSNTTLPGDARNCANERFCATRGTRRVQNGLLWSNSGQTQGPPRFGNLAWRCIRHVGSP